MLKNIGGNPRVDLNLNSNAHGREVVQVEGTAEIAEAVPPATGVGEYVEKYRESVARIDFDPESFARAYSVAIGSGPRAGRSGRPQEPKLRRGLLHKPLLG